MGEVTVTEALGGDHIDIATASGIVIARHVLAPRGADVQVGDHGNVLALETLVKGQAATGGRPYCRQERIPPGEATQEEANKFRTNNSHNNSDTDRVGSVVDLAVYERAAQNRNTLRAGDFVSCPGDVEHIFEAREPGTVAVMVTEVS
jgi:hypothetical protein